MGFEDSKVILIREGQKVMEFVVSDLTEKATCIDLNKHHIVVGYSNGIDP
jgi:hypothetical protein